MQPNQSRSFRLLLEMANHRIFDHAPELLPVLSLGEDTVAERPGPQPAFLGFLHLEDDFAHRQSFPEVGTCFKIHFLSRLFLKNDGAVRELRNVTV